MLMLFAAMSTFLTTTYAAEEQKKEELQIVPMIDRPLKKPKEGIIHADALQKGIFVTAVGGWSTVYPKTANLVKE